MFSHNAFADNVTTTISLGNQIPGGIDVNPNTNKIYVAAPDQCRSSSCADLIPNNELFIINGSTNDILGNLTVGTSPADVAVNTHTNKIYVSNQLSNTVSVIDGTTDSVVNTISIANAAGIAVNPNTNKIYVVDAGDGKVNVIDGTIDSVVNTISIANPTGIAVNPNTNKIYVASFYNNTVAVVDGATNNITSTVAVGNGPFGIGINPSATKIYVANFNDNTVSVLDSSTNSVVGMVSVGTNPEIVKVNPNTNKIYISLFHGNAIDIIDGTTNTLTQTLQVGEMQSGIGINPDVNKIYVSSRLVYVIQGNSSNTATASDTPTGLAATAVSPSQINLKWITPSNNGGSAITGYQIQRSTDNGATWNVIQSNTGSASTSYNDTGLAPSTTYTYQVSAINSVGTSQPSNTASATTTASGPTKATISVNSDDLCGNPITGLWTVIRYTNGTTITSGYTPTSFNVMTGTTYVVHVGNYGTETFSHWQDGTTSSYYNIIPTQSTTLTAYYNTGSTCGTTTPTVPSAPTGLSATATSTSQINLSWTAPSSNGGSAITGYNIYRGTTSGGESTTPIASITSTSYVDKSLTNGQTYYYDVKAVNSVGVSAPSNEASATPMTSSPPPSGIVLNNVQSTSGTASSNQITLSNFNAGSGTNQLLVVGISANNAAVTSVTFGGQALTKAVSSFSNNDAEFWYLKNPSGTGNVIVTMSGSTSAVVGAYAFSGVDQTTPIPTSIANHNTASGSPTISITTKYANDMVLDLPSIYGGNTLGSPTCTQEWNVNVPSAITGASSSTTVSSPSSVTCSWIASNGGDLWDDVAIEVKASK